MPAWVFVVGGLAVLVAALLAVDWFTSGRAKGRMLARGRAQSGSDSDAQVNLQLHQQHTEGIKFQNPKP